MSFNTFHSFEKKKYLVEKKLAYFNCFLYLFISEPAMDKVK